MAQIAAFATVFGHQCPNVCHRRERERSLPGGLRRGGKTNWSGFGLATAELAPTHDPRSSRCLIHRVPYLLPQRPTSDRRGAAFVRPGARATQEHAAAQIVWGGPAETRPPQHPTRSKLVR